MLLIFQFFINLPKEGKTTKEANMSGSIQAVSNYLQNFKAGFEEKYTRFVNWTSINLVDVKGTFALNETDGAVKKTARVFLGCLANLILLPFAGLAIAGKATINFFCGSMAASGLKQAEPPQSEATPLNQEADVSLG